jgi:hypothetical protein
MKALAIAQQQGQKIYTINQQNASTALAKLSIGGSVGQEIRNAVLSGKEVTVHEKPINAYGWTGYGYSIINPETGAGGYVIEGGGNGGVVNDLSYYAGLAAGLSIAAAVSMMFLAIATMSGMALAAVVMLGVIIILYTIAIIAMALQIYDLSEQEINCYMGGLLLGLSTSLAGMVNLISSIFFEFSVSYPNGFECRNS